MASRWIQLAIHPRHPKVLRVAALTGLSRQDDSQVWHLDVSKYYSERPGCHVKVIWGQP